MQTPQVHARARVLYWDRISRTDIPHGWRRERRPWRVDGIRTLVAHEDYTQTWKKDAQRNVRLWRQQCLSGEYRIDYVPYSVFKEAYKRSIVYKKVETFYTDAFERRPHHPDRETVACLVHHTPSNAYIAGTIMHFFNKRSASVRECSFMTDTTTRTLAPTGLMDIWHSEAQKRGIETLYFIYLWQPGDPKSWKAYSDFKERFGITRVAYPPRLKRFVWGKLW
ncbi:MAG TPA: hypothetical protein VIY48_08195 [Candidatus Paceibacterota bacterium]